MKEIGGIGLRDVQGVYSGAEGELWELLMGQQIHIGGLKSSLELAARAEIRAGQSGVDLCCCSGAGMRVLVRLLDAASMTGVDATATVVEQGRERCRAEGYGERIRFQLGDVCDTRLPGGASDFVWGEDAWCYVADKPRLIAEAVRLLKPGGTIAFTDWVEGPAGLTDAEAERCLRFMKFPTLASITDYRTLLEEQGCTVVEASDTGRFAPYLDLYIQMVDMQLAWDAMCILGFDQQALAALAGEMAFLQQLAHAGKIAQGRFVARRA